MSAGETHGCNWTELARCEAPLEGRILWQAILHKTEYPEEYCDAVTRAEVIDHDALTVVRRTWPAGGDPYIEYIHHQVCDVRVECERSGQHFRRAQAYVETPRGPCLVYQVDDPEAARRSGGIDASYASEVLQRLVDKAQSLVMPAVNGSSRP